MSTPRSNCNAKRPKPVDANAEFVERASQALAMLKYDFSYMRLSKEDIRGIICMFNGKRKPADVARIAGVSAVAVFTIWTEVGLKLDAN